MRAVKTLLRILLKVTIVAVLAAAVKGVVSLVTRGPAEDERLSVTDWPDVPEKPASA